MYNQYGSGLSSDKIFAKYRDKLIAKLNSDFSYNMKDTLNTINNLPNNFIEADISKNNTYLEWIVTSYINDGIRYYEDLLSKVRPTLNDFKVLVNSKKLSRGSGKAYENESDINNYCGLLGCNIGSFHKNGLDYLIDKYSYLLESKKIKDINKNKEYSKPIYDGEYIKIYVPKNEEESCHFGKGTKWCTAATDGNNMFDYYNKLGSLFIIIPKNPKYIGEKYQLHFPEDQYMNEKDNPVDLEELLVIYPELFKIVPLNNIITTNNIDIIKQSLEEGAKPSIESLDKAINTNDIDIIKLLIEEGAKPSNLSLNKAINTNNIDIIKLIIQEGTKPNNLSLEYAIDTNNLDIIKLIIQEGVKPSKESLEYAIYTNNRDIINLIINEGAKPSKKSLDRAIDKNNIDIIKLLIKAGAEPSEDSLNKAIDTNNIDIIKLVILSGAKPDDYTLNMSLNKNDIDIIKLVIKAGAKPNENTLSIAEAICTDDIIRLIKSYITNPNLFNPTKDNKKLWDKYCSAIKSLGVSQLRTILSEVNIKSINGKNIEDLTKKEICDLLTEYDEESIYEHNIKME